MSKKRLMQALLAAGGTGIVYANYDKMLDAAKDEFDPIESTMDGLEKYVLDPLGKLTPGQALTGAGVGLSGLAAYKAYQRLKAKQQNNS
jgi:hypothetical protein